MGTAAPSRAFHQYSDRRKLSCILIEGHTSGHTGIEIKNNVASNTNHSLP